MLYSEAELESWSNDQLTFKEILHRRSIASYITSLTLSSASTVASAGVLMPFTLPIGAFKAYKINSHKSKLNAVRAELARRHLSPAKKRSWDILVPVAIAFAVYVVTLGLADIIDIVPSDVVETLNDEVEAATGVGQGSGGLDKVGDSYQPFVVAEATSPLSNKAIKPALPSLPLPNKAYY